MGSSAKVAGAWALLLVVAAAVAVDVGSLSGGIGSTTTMVLPEAGCVCHGPGVSPSAPEGGSPTLGVVPFLRMDPQPFTYEENRVYNLTLGVTNTTVERSSEERANKMGFNLRVTGGTLRVPEGEGDFLQLLGPQEATHKADGDKRGEDYALQWQAPAEVGDAVVFTLFVNTVNGNGANDDGDGWNGLTLVVRGDPEAAIGGAGEEFDPREMGVDWFAFWVGGVAFLFMFAVLFLTYFVFKYGETVHATDQRDRKEK